MDDYKEMLEVVDETGRALRLERRDVIHREGLLHRDVLVWFYNDRDEILLERRGLSKDVAPGLLSSSVGGHPNPGETNLAAALREIKEETGLCLSKTKLVPFGTYIKRWKDEISGALAHHLRENFVYRWDGNIEDLVPVQKECDGWEWWSYDHLLRLSPAERRRFVPVMLASPDWDIFAKIHTFSQCHSSYS